MMFRAVFFFFSFCRCVCSQVADVHQFYLCLTCSHRLHSAFRAMTRVKKATRATTNLTMMSHGDHHPRKQRMYIFHVVAFFCSTGFFFFLLGLSLSKSLSLSSLFLVFELSFVLIHCNQCSRICAFTLSHSNRYRICMTE